MSKIIWATNPFRDSDSFRRKVGGLVLQLSRQAKLSVHPVFVVDPAETGVTFAIASQNKQKMVSFALTNLEKSVAPLRFKSVAPARVLYQSDMSVTASAKALSAHAKREKAQMILASTHARHGIGLLGMGSFVQALVGVSAVPVVSVNPARYREAPIKRILFATDFSPASRRAFVKLCELAKRLNAEIVISHAFYHPTFWIPEVPGMYSDFAQARGGEFGHEVERELEKNCGKLVRLAKGKGVRVTYSIEEVESSVAAVVLGGVRKHRADMIALAAESGRFVRGVLGTTTQRLVHNAKVPVWIYRS